MCQLSSGVCFLKQLDNTYGGFRIMIKTKVAFLEDWLLYSQSEQSEKFLKSTDWLEKATFGLIM